MKKGMTAYLNCLGGRGARSVHFGWVLPRSSLLLVKLGEPGCMMKEIFFSLRLIVRRELKTTITTTTTTKEDLEFIPGHASGYLQDFSHTVAPVSPHHPQKDDLGAPKVGMLS